MEDEKNDKEGKMRVNMMKGWGRVERWTFACLWFVYRRYPRLAPL